MIERRKRRPSHVDMEVIFEENWNLINSFFWRTRTNIVIILVLWSPSQTRRKTSWVSWLHFCEKMNQYRHFVLKLYIPSDTWNRQLVTLVRHDDRFRWRFTKIACTDQERYFQLIFVARLTLDEKKCFSQLSIIILVRRLFANLSSTFSLQLRFGYS